MNAMLFHIISDHKSPHIFPEQKPSRCTTYSSHISPLSSTS